MSDSDSSDSHNEEFRNNDMETEENEKNESFKATNIHTSSEYMELDEPEPLNEKKALLEEFERKKRARLITVPTDDYEVKDILRYNCEPICLFGEGPADRRNRLKDFLSRKEDEYQREGKDMSDDEHGQSASKEETWYHRGPQSLKEARMFIVNYSIPRARAKLKREKMEKQAEFSVKARKQEIQTKIRSYGLIGSQNADIRPLSSCKFSNNGEMIATSSWSGVCKVWKSSDCTEKLSLRGHDSFVDTIVWHPESGSSMDHHSLNLASCSRDGMVLLWSLNSSRPISTLPKFEARVSKIHFHPSGRFLGCAVHDKSWRLWDLNVNEEVLFQEGHSKPVQCIKFQKDGALAASGGFDSYGRIWDLRTGRCIMFLSGHDGCVIDTDWSPNGYQLVTGCEDNTAKIWDVRMRLCVYTIPAHTSLISGVVYDPVAGQYIVTCSYDGKVKMWSNGSTVQPLKVLEGHGTKVMGADISPVNNTVVTCSFDRTFKLWGPE